ncbi:hypothetical protein llap_5142 [Limosa lapponica baueri]|uniref:Uncharacterized protein n=1 Tax=Limosa lapponica baueri TaxID=1758121 RepID=A0A2I0UEU4_LIMLA|nr:hypothetical protein llap_5142 [Limosa lapponica baueri]
MTELGKGASATPVPNQTGHEKPRKKRSKVCTGNKKALVLKDKRDFFKILYQAAVFCKRLFRSGMCVEMAMIDRIDGISFNATGSPEMIRNNGMGAIAGFIKIHCLNSNNLADKSPTCPAVIYPLKSESEVISNKADLSLDSDKYQLLHMLMWNINFLKYAHMRDKVQVLPKERGSSFPEIKARWVSEYPGMLYVTESPQRKTPWPGDLVLGCKGNRDLAEKEP